MLGLRGYAPDQLQVGIAACGGVDAYYRYRLEEEKTIRRQMQAMAAASGNNNLQTFNLFPDNSIEVIEGAVISIGKKRLTIINELITEGLVTNLPDWWAIPKLTRQRVGEGGGARRSMVPDSRGERFVLQQDGVSWPIYCTWSNFSFNGRELALGQRINQPLDTAHATEATYRVNELCEDQAIFGLTDADGNDMTIDGLTAPGVLDSTTTFTYADWDGLTGAQIEDEVQDAIEQLRITHPGPYTLFVPANLTKALNKRYSTSYDSGTVRMKLEELGPYGGRTLKIVLSDALPDDRVVLMQMDRSAVDVVIGQQPTPLSWQDGPKWNTYWVVLACVIFRMFPNKNGDYGVNVGNIA